MGRMLLGKLEFAKAQGWAPSYVSELASHGRLVLVGEGRNAKVDVEASLARIGATAAGTRPDKAQAFAKAREGRAVDSGQPEAGKVGAGGTAAEVIETHMEGLGSEGGRLQVRKYRELVAREERLIDLGLFKGELVQRDEANRAWSGLGVALRANLEAFIERIAPALCGCGTREAVGEAMAVAMRGERRKLKKLMVGAVRAGRAG